MRSAVWLVWIALCSARASAADLVAKQVAAPAEDIVSGRVRLPDPASCATRSRALVIPFELAPALARASFETDVPVDASGPLALAIVSLDAPSLTMVARAPNGETLAFDELVARGHAERRSAILFEHLPGWRIERYDLAGADAGSWSVRIDAECSDPAPRRVRGFLVVRGASTIGCSAHVTSFATTADRDIGIVAHLDDAASADPKAPLRAMRSAATLVLETARSVERVVMHDDGMSADGASGDGVFGVLLPAKPRGHVRARVEMHGTSAAGSPLARSVQIAFPVVDRPIALSGHVRAFVEDETRLRIEIGALPLGPASKLHVSTEVWGHGADGAPVPVCWLSKMVTPEERAGAWTLAMHLDGRWLDVARASTPLVLRNVRVQEPGTHVVLDEVDGIPLAVDGLPSIVGRGQRTITTEMLTGPTSVSPAGPHTSIGGAPYLRTLMLVHGYCSGGSIWPAADFTEPKLEFLDPSQNRTHDQFAQLIAQAGSGYQSFGIVAHSQGGPAALHLYTYYQSPLDHALGARRIQSVCSPYQGTPLASLGFFACGVNDDMTPSGAVSWLAGIPSWARAEVHYWTTSDAGSACNFFTGLLLANPEDGTVEMFRGELPGGNAMGHVTGWCHTTGMSYPASYTDHARNAERDAQAAR